MPRSSVMAAPRAGLHTERSVQCSAQLPRTQRRAAARRAAKASRMSCKAALQFDTKVFQPEKVDLAGTTEYLYRGGRDQFQKLGKVGLVCWHCFMLQISSSASNSSPADWQILAHAPAVHQKAYSELRRIASQLHSAAKA